MKNILLLVAAPALLLTFGLAQTPAPAATTSASIKGCLGGTEGAYTVAPDGTTQTVKISASTVDLKPHIGHQVDLTAQKASVADTVSVTAVAMISEHCTMAAASAAPVADPATATLSAPAAPAAAPTPATPAATPVVVAAAPTPATPTATPVVVAAAPTPATPAAAPVVVAAPPAPPATTPEPVVAAKPAEPASTPVLASATAPLPNTAPPSLKTVKVTGKLSEDGKTFVGDKDSKSWVVTNPEADKGHEGHHVTLTAHLDSVKGEVQIVSLKMAK